MDEQYKKKIESTDRHRLHFRIETTQIYKREAGNRVKILINGVDVLTFGVEDDEHLGLQPEKMAQTDLLQPGKCLIGVCSCGDEGCGPYYVDISINDDCVTWDDPQAECQYNFDKTEYELAIKKLQKMLTDYLSDNHYKPTKEDLEEYKKEVYDYLTQQLKVPTTAAKNRVKNYKAFFKDYLENNWGVSATATTMMYNF